mmetsp:Transcript_10772/g.34267  ORF Transcript_10772/g.34267 Transcript_10772/m.34267 type:complete len:399 (+) Transcript_10772:832-2028(+)
MVLEPVCLQHRIVVEHFLSQLLQPRIVLELHVPLQEAARQLHRLVRRQAHARWLVQPAHCPHHLQRLIVRCVHRHALQRQAHARQQLLTRCSLGCAALAVAVHQLRRHRQRLPEVHVCTRTEAVSVEIDQACGHNADLEAWVCSHSAQRHDGDARLEGQQRRPVVRAALWEDADAPTLAQARPHLVEHAGVVHVGRVLEGARGRGRVLCRLTKAQARVRQHLSHGVTLFAQEHEPTTLHNLGELGALAQHLLPIRRVQTDHALHLACNILRPRDRNGPESSRQSSNHLTFHRLGRDDKPDVIARTLGRNDGRVEELVGVWSAHEDDWARPGHRQVPRARHLLEKDEHDGIDQAPHQIPHRRRHGHPEKADPYDRHDHAEGQREAQAEHGESHDPHRAP